MTGASAAAHDRERLESILTEIARQLVEHGLDALEPWGCSEVCVDVCPERASAVVGAGACRLGVAARSAPNLARELGARGGSAIAGAIDHTLLKPEATLAEIDKLCAEALELRFASVCVNSCHVRRCAEILAGSGVIVCAVVGFPLGAMHPEAKVYEARRAIEEGACEIDMVQNVGWLKSRLDQAVRDDVAGVAELCHSLGARLKVILETALLTDEEKVRACRLAVDAGADFVKTSTGFGKGGATVADVALMRRAVGPAIGVKAAGGIRDAAQAEALIEAGATRIGASASVAIAREGAGGTRGVAAAAPGY
jgi:deoxyribose-phosphate aldolase